MDQPNGNGQSSGRRGGGSRSHAKNRTLTEVVQEEPIACLAIAVAAGFLLGGGARRAGGLTILTMLGQIVVRETLGESASSLGELFNEA
jgi:hypothetical protein